MLFDPVYLLFVGPALLLSLWASWLTKSRFNTYSRIATSSGLSGAEAAARILASAGIRDVTVGRSSGLLSDHYNPITKTLNLSDGVYAVRSVAAVGIAAHEAGHAIQHAHGYKPLWLRSLLVPTASIGSSLGYIVMAGGLFLQSANMVLLGAVLFSAVLLFQVVTLPVELNASSRAKQLVADLGIVYAGERDGVAKVLNAAALTYVAAAVSTLLTLLYFLFRAGLIGGSRDE